MILGKPNQGACGKTSSATKGTSLASRLLSKKFPEKWDLGNENQPVSFRAESALRIFYKKYQILLEL